MVCKKWSRAFSVSCMIHLLFIMLLVILLEHTIADSRQLVEEYVSIEFAEAAVNHSQDYEQRQSSTVFRRDHSGAVSNSAAKKTGKAAAAYSPASMGNHPVVVNGEGNGTVTTVSGAEKADFQPPDGLASGKEPGIGEGGRNIDGIIDAFLAQIEKRKEYPYMARRLGKEGTVAVAVRLTAGGELAGVQVLRSSGVPDLDEAALSLVRKVCPFPHNAGRAITMNIPIAYRLE